MGEEGREVGEGDGVRLARERFRLLAIRTADGDDPDAADKGGGAHVRRADAAPAENADLHSIRRMRTLRNQIWSPWSCSRMCPSCTVPNRSMPLNLLLPIAARRAGLPSWYCSTRRSFSQCPTLDPSTSTRLVFHSPAGFTGGSAAASTS